jgi:hypothetical protein
MSALEAQPRGTQRPVAGALAMATRLVLQAAGVPASPVRQ